MVPHMENPAALETCGAPKNDLAGALITFESTSLQHQLQVIRLTRCCGVNADMAETLAPLVFEVPS
jgi:hypothetical protein